MGQKEGGKERDEVRVHAQEFTIRERATLCPQWKVVVVHGRSIGVVDIIVFSF